MNLVTLELIFVQILEYFQFLGAYLSKTVAGENIKISINKSVFSTFELTTVPSVMKF